MQITCANNIKIYNLSAGRSLPEWLSDRKKRALSKKNVDIRRRIELIQDFSMPAVSDNIKLSPNGEYIMATGIYKPRLRCYDVNHLSLKFERCFDSEVLKFQILSDDYSKAVFLQSDRYIEFHAAFGKYYRLRIPRFGHDLVYHQPSCDVMIVGDSNEVYRLNLERGTFLNPYITESPSINSCDLNPVHQLLVTGGQDGRVEAWDPRTRTKVGTLDCAKETLKMAGVKGGTGVSCVKFCDGLKLGVGTQGGQVLLYDIRSHRPLLSKDHMYGLPIKTLCYHPHQDMVLSLDAKVLKIWSSLTGTTYTSIEGQKELNDVALAPGGGLLFMATEQPKMLVYFLPSLGPAPRWCSFLDSITEELEENDGDILFDDYKFVTKKELEDLNLGHLIGSSLLRAYMHGYFMDIRLYHKAKLAADPFAFQDYKKRKIKEKLEEECQSRVKVKKLPKVNRNLASKLLTVGDSAKGENKLLTDDRFAAMFANPDFQINEDSEEYRLIQPLVTKLDKQKKAIQKVDSDEDDVEGAIEDSSSDFEEDSAKEEEQSEEEGSVSEEEEEMEVDESLDDIVAKQERLRLTDNVKMITYGAAESSDVRLTLEERLGQQTHTVKNVRGGNREITFLSKRKVDRKLEAEKRHKMERKSVRRTTNHLARKNKGFS